MLYWALNCLIVAFVAGIFGFADSPGNLREISQILFLLFLVLFLAFTIRGLALKSRQRILQDVRRRAISRTDQGSG